MSFALVFRIQYLDNHLLTFKNHNSAAVIKTTYYAALLGQTLFTSNTNSIRFSDMKVTIDH